MADDNKQKQDKDEKDYGEKGGQAKRQQGQEEDKNVGMTDQDFDMGTENANE